jgi:hypothetical protein
MVVELTYSTRFTFCTLQGDYLVNCLSWILFVSVHDAGGENASVIGPLLIVDIKLASVIYCRNVVVAASDMAFAT